MEVTTVGAVLPVSVMYSSARNLPSPAQMIQVSCCLVRKVELPDQLGMPPTPEENYLQVWATWFVENGNSLVNSKFIILVFQFCESNTMQLFVLHLLLPIYSVFLLCMKSIILHKMVSFWRPIEILSSPYFLTGRSNIYMLTFVSDSPTASPDSRADTEATPPRTSSGATEQASIPISQR